MKAHSIDDVMIDFLLPWYREEARTCDRDRLHVLAALYADSAPGDDDGRDHATAIYAALAETGDVPALVKLARLHEETGNLNRARDLLARAAAAGDVEAWRRLSADTTFHTRSPLN